MLAEADGDVDPGPRSSLLFCLFCRIRARPTSTNAVPPSRQLHLDRSVSTLRTARHTKRTWSSAPTVSRASRATPLSTPRRDRCNSPTPSPIADWCRWTPYAKKASLQPSIRASAASLESIRSVVHTYISSPWFPKTSHTRQHIIAFPIKSGKIVLSFLQLNV